MQEPEHYFTLTLAYSMFLMKSYVKNIAVCFFFILVQNLETKCFVFLRQIFFTTMWELPISFLTVLYRNLFSNFQTKFLVMCRKTGKLIAKFHSEPFFYLHIINQYEIDEYLVIDICCYRDPYMIECMYVEAMEVNFSFGYFTSNILLM